MRKSAISNQNQMGSSMTRESSHRYPSPSDEDKKARRKARREEKIREVHSRTMKTEVLTNNERDYVSMSKFSQSKISASESAEWNHSQLDMEFEGMEIQRTPSRTRSELKFETLELDVLYDRLMREKNEKLLKLSQVQGKECSRVSTPTETKMKFENLDNLYERLLREKDEKDTLRRSSQLLITKTVQKRRPQVPKEFQGLERRRTSTPTDNDREIDQLIGHFDELVRITDEIEKPEPENTDTACQWSPSLGTRMKRREERENVKLWIERCREERNEPSTESATYDEEYNPFFEVPELLEDDAENYYDRNYDYNQEIPEELKDSETDTDTVLELIKFFNDKWTNIDSQATDNFSYSGKSILSTPKTQSTIKLRRRWDVRDRVDKADFLRKLSNLKPEPRPWLTPAARARTFPGKPRSALV